MCGIMGMSWMEGAISPGRRAILSNHLAIGNDKRGGHSWSVTALDNKEINISRGLGNMGDHAWHLADTNFYFAHTRFATIGAKTVENAHSFEIGDIIGSHNGAVSNHSELDRKYNRKCDVDSMHIFYHLNEKLPLDTIEGYGAIEWVSKKDLTKIYLSKLKGGSLAIFGIGSPEDAKTKGVVWSSDEKHLLEALFAAGIKEFFPYKVEEGVVFFATNGEVYIDNHRKLEIGKEVHRKATSYYEHDSYSGYTNRSSFQTTGGSTNSSTKSESNTERDYADWQEWIAYCEANEGKATSGASCSTTA
jgi:hypothetical protein